MAFIAGPALAAFPGVGSAAGGAIAGAGAAGGAGILATLGGLAASPIFGPLMSIAGGKLISGLFGGQSDYERAAQQQMQAGLSVLPELQRAAAGLPTASSRNIMAQVRQEGTRQRQAFSASARQAGTLGQLPGGSQPFRSETARQQETNRAIMAQRLGAFQTSAMQTLTGQITPGIQAGQRQEALRQQEEGMTMVALARFMRYAAGNKAEPETQELLELAKELARRSLEALAPAPIPATPPSSQFTIPPPRQGVPIEDAFSGFA